MQSNTPNTRLIIAGVGAAIVIAGIVIASIFASHSTKPAGSTGEYYDKNSGETISNPEGKAPDTFGATPGTPTFLGVTSFLQYGVSSDQLKGLKIAFTQYSKQSKKNIKEVSVNPPSLVKSEHDRNSATNVDSITFKVILDRKDTYTGKLNFFDITAVDLFLYDLKGNQVFDSGTIDPTVTGD